MEKYDDMMQLSAVPSYVLGKTGREITRQTAYNWASKGVRSELLRTVRVAGQLHTRREWVDDFLGRI